VRSRAIVRNVRRVLCVFPAYAPAFGTFSHALRLVGAKAFMPPQGLLLIANYLPDSWLVRLIDENIARAALVRSRSIDQYHSPIVSSAAAWCDLFREFRRKEIALMKSIGITPGVCVIAAM
jgi:hypothetical protein